MNYDFINTFSLFIYISIYIYLLLLFPAQTSLAVGHLCYGSWGLAVINKLVKAGGIVVTCNGSIRCKNCSYFITN